MNKEIQVACCPPRAQAISQLGAVCSPESSFSGKCGIIIFGISKEVSVFESG